MVHIFEKDDQVKCIWLWNVESLSKCLPLKLLLLLLGGFETPKILWIIIILISLTLQRCSNFCAFRGVSK